MLKLTACFVSLLAFAAPAAARCPAGADPARFVSGGGLCLAMQAFGAEGARPGGRLVVFLAI